MLRVLTTILFISCISVAHAHSTNECLASAIFYEANLEPIEGKVAVAEVIENRANAHNMTVCQVVKQKGQFTWYPSKPIKKYNKEMKELLTIVKNHPRILRDESYMFFFDKRLRPKWAKRMQCRVIGGHRFCHYKSNI